MDRSVRRARVFLRKLNSIKNRIQEREKARNRLYEHLQETRKKPSKKKIDNTYPLIELAFEKERELSKNQYIESKKVQDLKKEIRNLYSKYQNLANKFYDVKDIIKEYKRLKDEKIRRQELLESKVQSMFKGEEEKDKGNGISKKTQKREKEQNKKEDLERRKELEDKVKNVFEGEKERKKELERKAKDILEKEEKNKEKSGNAGKGKYNIESNENLEKERKKELEKKVKNVFEDKEETSKTKNKKDEKSTNYEENIQKVKVPSAERIRELEEKVMQKQNPEKKEKSKNKKTSEDVEVKELKRKLKYLERKYKEYLDSKRLTKSQLTPIKRKIEKIKETLKNK